MIVIDYDIFLAKRFDLLIRYHLLSEAEFNVAKATELAMSKKYAFLRKVSEKLIKKDMKDFPVVAKKMKKSMETYPFPIGEMVLFYLFSHRKYRWLENRIKKNPAWMKKCPYPVNEYCQSGANKRFLLALKYDRPLYWEREKLKVPRPSRAIWREKEYKKYLTPEQFEMFMNTKIKLCEHMNRLSFFSERFEVCSL